MFAKGVQHVGKLGQVHTQDCRKLCAKKIKIFLIYLCEMSDKGIGKGIDTVDSEIVVRILFSRIALKDILVT